MTLNDAKSRAVYGIAILAGVGICCIILGLMAAAFIEKAMGNAIDAINGGRSGVSVIEGTTK